VRAVVVTFVLAAGCSIGATSGLSSGGTPDQPTTDPVDGAAQADASGESGFPDEDGSTVIVDTDAGNDAGISAGWRDTKSVVYNDPGPTTFVIDKPTGTTAGDVLVAGLHLGNSGNATLPVWTPPSGWTLARRVDHGNATSLAVYTHVAGSNEPANYTWTSDLLCEGVAWISAFAGVDTSQPVDVVQSADLPSSTSFSTLAATATTTNGWVIGAFAARGVAGAWTPPAGVDVRMNRANATTRSGLAFDTVLVSKNVGAMTATLPATQDYGLSLVLVLRAK